MTDTQADVDRTEHEGSALVTVRGEVDMSNADVVGRQIRAAGGPDDAVLLDLSAIQFFDSSALRMLNQLHGELEEAGRQLTIVAPPSGIVGRLLIITTMDAYLRVRGSL